MVYERTTVTDEDRREFLKALGVGGAVAAGSVTLEEVRKTASAETESDLAPIGQAIQSDLSGAIDAELLVTQQAAFAEQASALPATAEKGLPAEQRDDFSSVAEAGRPVYDHLLEIGFFESTTRHLPEFTSTYLEDSVKVFVGAKGLIAPLVNLGFTEQESVDLVTTVIANAQRINDYHWVATDKIPRQKIGFGEFIPPMTQGAAGGVLLWLESLDRFLWNHAAILTEDILEDATWHAHSMAAGFQLVTEGAKMIAEDSESLSDNELGALLSTGFAIQAISQNLLPQDACWVTDEMRDKRRTNLETVKKSF